MRSPHLSEKAIREIEEDFKNTHEAFTLLAMINAEFQSDPLSTQCFDQRTVERVKTCVVKRMQFVKNHPVFGK